VNWQQAHGLDAETLAKREVVKIDIANDLVRPSVSILIGYSDQCCNIVMALPLLNNSSGL